jgi:predicted acetyltransferase
MEIKSTDSQSFKLIKNIMVEVEHTPYVLIRAALRKSLKQKAGHVGYRVRFTDGYSRLAPATLLIERFRKEVNRIQIGCKLFKGENARKLYRWATRKA